MFQIRRYESSDREAVWALHNLALNQVGAHLGNGPWDDDLHHIPEVYLNDGGEFLVAVFDSRIVAMGALKRGTAQAAEVKRMRVHPDFQRRGFGQAILHALEAGARTLGYQRLTLDTTVGQTAARSLYTRNGYVEIGRTQVGPFRVILFEKQLGGGRGGARQDRKTRIEE